MGFTGPINIVILIYLVLTQRQCKNCESRKCGYRVKGLRCTAACGCADGTYRNPLNCDQDESVESDEPSCYILSLLLCSTFTCFHCYIVSFISIITSTLFSLLCCVVILFHCHVVAGKLFPYFLMEVGCFLTF